MKMDKNELARFIDHTNLKIDASRSDIKKLCEEAIKYGFFGVCVTPYRVKDAKEFLKNSEVRVVSVVGFPLGANTIDVKVHEIIKAAVEGANEIDAVINVGAVKDNKLDYVDKEIESLVEVAHGMGCIIKIIIETSVLNTDEIKKLSTIVADKGADFIKTNTGFALRGVTLEDVKTIKETVGNKIGIKASGGIRDAKFALELIREGATRLGSSRSIEIIESLNYL